MRFFHWHLAFPNIFPVDGEGGFDCVLGNPPWDRVKLQEKEFFASRHPVIADAPNKATRERMIKGLAESDPALLTAWEAAQRDAEGASHFIRNSGRYPLCGRGDVNTYAVFAENDRSIIATTGRVGCIVPTGIATDDTTKLFFQDIVERQSLVSLFDFENAAPAFPGVHRSYKFSLLTLVGRARPSSAAEFAFFTHRVADLNHPDRRFELTRSEIRTLNPNTRTCPIFRSRRDAQLTLGIYGRADVLKDESALTGWDVDYLLKLVDPTIHRDLLVTRRGDGFYDTAGERVDDTVLRAAYEGKQIHQYDHRFASVGNSAHGGEPEAAALSEAAKADPDTYITPRYWITASDFAARLRGRPVQYPGFLSVRDITNVTNERTVIACLRPNLPALNSIGSLFCVTSSDAAVLCACLNSFAADYVARQKVGGSHLSPFYLYQLAVVGTDAVDTRTTWLATRTPREFIVARVLELTYTAYDLTGFARDLGYDGPPFRWDLERRFLLRAELDAAFFHLYSIEHDDVDYILDTFPIVRRKDEKAHGEYRTKRVSLDIYDDMADAKTSGSQYQTRLDPPPADPRAAHAEGVGGA
jgi:hypothetical protein